MATTPFKNCLAVLKKIGLLKDLHKNVHSKFIRNSEKLETS